MERIAGEIGWEDKELFTCLRTGFSLTGNQEKTGIFPDDFKPPCYGVEELVDRAKFVKSALWGKIRQEPLQSFSQELWDITVAEQKGWLGPPMRFEQLEATFQSRWPVRRFAVMQNNKCRPIDDFSENGVNSCFGSVERVDLRALDAVRNRRDRIFMTIGGAIFLGQYRSLRPWTLRAHKSNFYYHFRKSARRSFA